MSNKIQSVGYKITTPCSIIRDVISKVYGPEQVNNFNIELETENIVLRCLTFREIKDADDGILYMGSSSEREMKCWYNIRKEKVFDAYIQKIWIVKNPRVIICDIDIKSTMEDYLEDYLEGYLPQIDDYYYKKDYEYAMEQYCNMLKKAHVKDIPVDESVYSVIAKPTTRIFKSGLKKDIISNKYGNYIECNIKVKAIPYFKTGDYFLT